MNKFIQIRSTKFPILPGELDELVNEGTYGKALAEYLQLNLRSRGYDAPAVCSEDWGWWVALKTPQFTSGVCVYSGQAEGGPVDFAITDGLAGSRKWSWRQFRFIETATWGEQLHSDLIAILSADSQIEILGITDEFPDLNTATC